MELVLCSLWLSRRYCGGGAATSQASSGHKAIDWAALHKGLKEKSLSPEALRARLAIDLDAAAMVWEAERRRLEEDWGKV